MIRTGHRILFALSNQEEYDGRGMWQVMEDRRGECWVVGGYLRERNYLEHLGVERRIILKWIFKKEEGMD
jgi:hypothetical protein